VSVDASVNTIHLCRCIYPCAKGWVKRRGGNPFSAPTTHARDSITCPECLVKLDELLSTASIHLWARKHVPLLVSRFPAVHSTNKVDSTLDWFPADEPVRVTGTTIGRRNFTDEHIANLLTNAYPGIPDFNTVLKPLVNRPRVIGYTHNDRAFNAVLRSIEPTVYMRTTILNPCAHALL
jgi:hypothetical protein